MTNGSGSETPKTKIATAQATFALAVRINAEVVAGRLRSTIYQREVVVVTGGNGLLLPRDYRAGRQDLLDGTQNLVVMALGASALTLDETLDEIFGKPDVDPEPNRRGLRVMVNQLRNAFAHNPWRPRWVIWPKYRALYAVMLGASTQTNFDATSLDGQGVKPEDVGGLESWVKVLKHCEGIVPG
jgi:hypothetical protein